MTRVPQYESQQNIVSNSDLTQTRVPIHVIQNDLTLSKAPRISHDPNLSQKQITQQQTSNAILNKKNEFFSERVIMNKLPNKPVHTVREVISLKPQVSAIRNIDNKIHYVKLNPLQDAFNRQ